MKPENDASLAQPDIDGALVGGASLDPEAFARIVRVQAPKEYPMSVFLVVIHVFVCIFLIAVVLLQRGEGAEIGAVFGGGASSTVFGSRGAGNFLERSPPGGAIFMITSLTLAYVGRAHRRAALRRRGRPRPPSRNRVFEELARRPGGDAPGGVPEVPAPDAPAPEERAPRRSPAIAARGPFGMLRLRSSSHLRQWRNWQTHQLEGLAGATPWRFESSLPHHSTGKGTIPDPMSDLEKIARAMVAPHKESSRPTRARPRSRSASTRSGSSRPRRTAAPTASCFFTTPGVEEYISGVILYDETIRQ